MESTEKKFMVDPQGRQVPVELIKDIDLLRDQTVSQIMKKAFEMRNSVQKFKAQIAQDINTFCQMSAEQHNVKFGGKKGNLTLSSFDGKYKISINVADNKVFNEKLQVAKSLIDNCIRRWSQGSRPEIRILVEDAFQVDKQGNVNTGRILGLRRLKIEDEEWKQAMECITESLSVTDSKSYLRFYERKDDGSYQNIPLDIATL